MSRTNVPYDDLVTLTAAGGVASTTIQSSGCHALRADLADAVEWRIRSMTMTIEPIVASTDAGTISAVLCPTNWTPTTQAAIMNNGGSRKKLTQKTTITIQGSDDAWINHANGKAHVYLSDDTTAKVSSMVRISYTIQIRGHR